MSTLEEIQEFKKRERAKRRAIRKLQPKLEIAKMLVLSTAHVSRDTADLLDIGAPTTASRHSADFGIGFPKGDYGWFVYVPEEPEEEGDIPDDLLRVVAFAREQGCKWLMFDRDADKIDALPTWEW